MDFIKKLDQEKRLIDIADYIIVQNKRLTQNDESPITMTSKRLIKLLYFCDKEYRKIYCSKLVNVEYYLWESGPVIPDLYYKYSHTIDSPLQSEFDADKIPNNKKFVINKVLNKLKNVRTHDLCEIATKDFVKNKNSRIIIIDESQTKQPLEF